MPFHIAWTQRSVYGAAPSKARNFAPAAQYLCYAPCLGDATARSEWLLGIEDLADLPHAGSPKLAIKGAQKLSGMVDIVVVHLQPGINKRADQPRPNGALVVRSISRVQVSEKLALVIRMAWRKGTQADGRQQFLFNNVHGALPFQWLEHWMI